MKFGLLVSLLLVLFSGFSQTSCKSHSQKISNKSGYSRTEVLRFRWRKKLHSNIPDFKIPEFYEVNDRFNPVETSSAAFDAKNKTMFIGAGVGGFYCLDMYSGKTLWRYDLQDPVGSTAMVDSKRQRVYFGADDGYLYALHSRSGRLIWSLETGAEIRSKIWEKDDTLFVMNANDTLYAVDPLSGEVVWRYRRTRNKEFSSVGYADLAFEGEAVYAGFSDGVLVSLDTSTGEVNWETDLASEAVADPGSDNMLLSDIDATPVVKNGTIVAASLYGGAFGLNSQNGDILWRRSDIQLATGAAYYHGEVIFVRSGNMGMIAVDIETGNTIFESRFGLGIKKDPLVYDDLALISDSEAGLYIVSAGTGKVLNLFDVMGGFFAAPSEYGGYLVVLGNWSTVFTFTIN